MHEKMRGAREERNVRDKFPSKSLYVSLADKWAQGK
jgi:hypothetical protein